MSSPEKAPNNAGNNSPPAATSTGRPAFVRVTPSSKWAPKRRKIYSDSEEPVTYQVIHVNPAGTNPDRVEGFVLVCLKFPEHVMTSPLFLKMSDPVKVEFLEQTNCVNKALPIKDWTKDDGTFLQNKICRDAKGLVFNFPGIKQDEIRDFVNNHLTECLKLLPKRMRNIKDADFPHLREDRDYVTVSTWDMVLSDEDILFLIKKQTDNISAYLKDNKSNIYSHWRKGKFPLWIMRHYNLEEQHLDKEDWARLQQQNDNDAKAFAKAQSDYDCSRINEHDGGAYAPGFNPVIKESDQEQ